MTLDRDVMVVGAIVAFGAVLARLFGRSECRVPAGPSERGGRIRRLLLVD